MANLRQLGDSGMLVDDGPSLRGLTQGLVTKEGPQQVIITAPLTSRNLHRIDGSEWPSIETALRDAGDPRWVSTIGRLNVGALAIDAIPEI